MDEEIRKNVLLVSYDFPPVGGGGIQRNVKYLKYLSRKNWITSVLTVKERDYYVFDYTLLDEIKETKIFRANSIDPLSISYKLKNILKNKKGKTTQESGKIDESAWYVSVYRFIKNWFLIPDSYGGWVPFAYKKGKDILKKEKINVILITFPCPSNALVGYLLHRKSKVPFVIDFRDAWLDDPYAEFTWWLHRKVHTYLENKVVSAASRVIVYGEPLKIILESKYPQLKGKISIITNGYDPEDFEAIQPIKKQDKKVRIVYSGSVYVDRRETFKCFVTAVSMLSEYHKNKVEVIFVGDILKWAYEFVEQNKVENIIKFTGYKTHSESLNYLASADAALLFLKKGDFVAYTGKIFEYIGIGLPVMACVESEGACAKLLESINHNQGVVEPDDIAGMKTKLEEIIDNGLPLVDNEKAKVYSRRFHAEILNRVLNEIT